jgi:hypothetical protein
VANENQIAPHTAADARELAPGDTVWSLPVEYRAVPKQLGGPADVGQ